jgi:hypothetical protein
VAKKQKVLIVYAYGASNESGVNVRAAAVKGMKSLDIAWTTIDWRPHLSAPSCQDLLAAASRSVTNSNPSELVKGSPTIGDRVIGKLQAPVNAALRRLHRTIIVDSGTTISDVLGYVQRPDPLRQHVREMLDIALAEGRRDDRPVVALGLSLGGILLADVLRERTDQDEDRYHSLRGLITIGSQYGLLKRFGIVEGNVLAAPLFTPWVNLWHPNDFLSYAVGITFDELGTNPTGGAVDIESIRRGFFPGIHSGYLLPGSSDWRLIEQAIRRHFLEAGSRPHQRRAT